MNNITMQSAVLTAVRTLARRPGTADALPQLDPEVAQRLKEMREQATQAMQTLDKAKVDMRKQRKQAALEKLKRINEALRMLRMVGGDPKAMAREGARLARELAAATKEYRAANNGASASDGAPPVTEAMPPAASAPAVDAAPAEPTADAAPAAEGDGEGGGEKNPGNPEEATDGTAPAQPGIAAKDGGAEGKNARTSDTFADEARALAKKLKEFLNQQKERLKAVKGDGFEQAEKEVTAALEELRRTERMLDMPDNVSDPLATVNIVI
ncbi:MAG TPA: hypothetical protein VD978_26035 [Azospirillum sp.]|nr:hypothetical protein [Azospirillum sp.]